MVIKSKFNHYCFNVLNLERSIAFFDKAIGLKENRRVEAPDGSAVRVYLGDGESAFELELTCLANRTEPYELGENQVHLCVELVRGSDTKAIRDFHNENGWIVREIPQKNIHFIEDPDGHVIEIFPAK